MRHDEPLIAQDAAPVCTKNKAPILHKYCTTRHRPGGLGPFSLLDYAIAMENVADIKDA